MKKIAVLLTLMVFAACQFLTQAPVPDIAAQQEIARLDSLVQALQKENAAQEERIKAICMEICKIIAYAEATGAQVNANTEDIEKLATELANIKEDFADEFEDYFKERIAEWLDAHIYEVLDKAVRFVQFGLSQDGYFQAYIPENWDFLQFDTGMVYGRDDYGHLIIRY